MIERWKGCTASVCFSSPCVCMYVCVASPAIENAFAAIFARKSRKDAL